MVDSKKSSLLCIKNDELSIKHDEFVGKALEIHHHGSPRMWPCVEIAKH